MNRRDLFRTALSVPLAGTAFALPSPPNANSPLLKVGFAEEDITPEVGSEQPGGYGKSYHTTIHDPCKVRVAVFDDGSNAVALVGLDALLVPRYIVDRARADIEGRCGVPGPAVMIGASHSHSSGPIGMIKKGDYDHASEFVQRLAYEHSTLDDADYSRTVEQKIVAAVCRAFDQRAPMSCSIGAGSEDQVAFNRRFSDAQRPLLLASRAAPGILPRPWGFGSQVHTPDPDILGPAGPTDPVVTVLGAWGEDRKLRGCVVNYSCHATTNPGGISANWIYYLEKTIRGVLGPDVTVVFLQGFCGDVTQVDNLSPYKRKSGEEEAILVGGRVGAEAVKVLLASHGGSLGPVAAHSETIRLARRKPDSQRVRDSLQIAKKDPQAVGPTEWTFAKEIVLLDALVQKAPELDVEIQAIQVGPAVFLSTPGEMFVDFGLRLRKRSGFPFTVPVELANGTAGYIPTEEALGPHGGGYETRLTSYSNLVPSAGRQIVEAAVRLAGSLEPGAVPHPPKASPVSADGDGIGAKPWSYGNVPPELK